MKLTAQPNSWVKDEDGDVIATIANTGNITGKPIDALPKTLLFAAAYDMLEALKLWQAEYTKNQHRYIWTTEELQAKAAMDSAIAKATGTQS